MLACWTNPQLGQFVLIELASEEEASLGRITRLVPTGILTSTQERRLCEYIRANQEVPEDLKQHARLEVPLQLKLLGAVHPKP